MRITVLLIALALVLTIPVSSFADEEEVEWDGITFELENLDGDDMTEEEVFTGGKIYLVDFWASYCRPCSEYLPHLEDMVDEYGEDGFSVVIFCVDDAGSVSTAKSTLVAEDYPFTILFDTEQDVKNELGVRSIPTTVIFDQSGEELWRHVSYSTGDEEEVREVVEELLYADEEEEEE